jgi:hypothetical protein
MVKPIPSWREFVIRTSLLDARFAKPRERAKNRKYK